MKRIINTAIITLLLTSAAFGASLEQNCVDANITATNETFRPAVEGYCSCLFDGLFKKHSKEELRSNLRGFIRMNRPLVIKCSASVKHLF